MEPYFLHEVHPVITPQSFSKCFGDHTPSQLFRHACSEDLHDVVLLNKLTAFSSARFFAKWSPCIIGHSLDAKIELIPKAEGDGTLLGQRT